VDVGTDSGNEGEEGPARGSGLDVRSGSNDGCEVEDGGEGSASVQSGFLYDYSSITPESSPSSFALTLEWNRLRNPRPSHTRPWHHPSPRRSKCRGLGEAEGIA
jgi:hypothetical protein